MTDRVFQVGGGRLGGGLSHPADGNVWAVDAGDGVLLVDAGTGLDPDRLAGNLRAVGVGPGDVRGLLLTHAHLDHSGGAAWFHREWGVPVTAPARSAAALEAGDEDRIGLPLCRRLGLYPADARWRPCPVARRAADGDAWAAGDLRVWAVETPGHSADSVTYVVDAPEGRLAFTGDAVFAGGIVLMSTVPDCSPAAQADSLRRLAGLGLDRLYPGHGPAAPGTDPRLAVPYLDRLLLPPNLL